MLQAASASRNTRYRTLLLACITAIVAVYGVYYIKIWPYVRTAPLSSESGEMQSLGDVNAINIIFTYIVPILNIAAAILPLYLMVHSGLMAAIVDNKDVSSLRSKGRMSLLILSTVLIIVGLIAPPILTVTLQSQVPSWLSSKQLGEKKAAIMWAIVCVIVGMSLTLLPNFWMIVRYILFPTMKTSAHAAYLLSRYPRVATAGAVGVAGMAGFGIGNVSGMYL